jgi:hypothetical protein
VSENLFGEVVHDVEQVAEEFLPKPGGMIDRWHQESARRHEAERERENVDARIEAPGYRAVKTVAQSPEVFSATTFTLGIGQSLMILPFSPYRFRASIFQVTPTGNGLVLAKDQGAAISGNGFFLPSGIIYPIMTRAQVWAFNGTGSVIQVSVGSEIYAPEK